jgi:hypothetical protein
LAFDSTLAMHATFRDRQVARENDR